MAAHTPRQIGRYDVLDRLGYGGMGMVFRGRDPHIGRAVAIKLLRVSDEDLHDRFLREAQSAGGLKHPNIVTIYDFGEHEGAPFIVMEYVEGTTLAEHIKQNIPLTLGRKLELLEELAAGLEYAHNKGVVHRDVKPANVMVDREGVLRILDFGIARVTDSGLTQTGMIMGTPNYMSPEQVEGKASDRRSDIFSAGLVMYELLSYHQAFPGDTMHQVMNAIVREAPTALRSLVPDLDPALETIVNRAIEKDPARRYQTMAAMRTHIARLRSKLAPETALDEGTVISAPGAPPPPRTDRVVLEQRRAERIQTLLETAQRALDTGRFVDALDACEQVALISPDDAAAAALMDRARTALDQQQLEQLIAEARTCIEEGHLAEAAELARRGLGINPDSAGAAAILDEIDGLERGERERAVRERAVALAIDKCRDAALAGDAEGVIAAAENVLALDPAHAEARELMAEARGLIEARERERQAERRARDAVDRARREFQDGHHDESIAALEGFAPPHPIVSRALDELRAERAEFERLKREAERQRHREAEEAAAEKQLQIAVGLSRAAIALGDQRFADASSAVDAVLALDPEHPRALGLRAEIAAALEARQRQEETDRRSDEASASAREAQRERHAAGAQLADAEAAANGWDPPRTLAILETLEARVKARADLQDLLPRIEQLSVFARKRLDLLRQFREATAQQRSGALLGALATIERALAEEPHLPGAVELRERIQGAIAAEGQQRARDEAAQAAVAAARRLAVAGRLDEGIRQLEQADTSHAAVAAALGDLRREHADLQRREREQRESDEKRVQARRAEIAALLKRARKAKSPDAAIALLRSVLELDPENADAQDALGRYQERRRDRPGAAGTAGTVVVRSRTNTIWRVGGLASAIVTFLLLAYVITHQPEAPSGPPAGTTPPPSVVPPSTAVSSAPTTSIPPPRLEPTTVPPTSIAARGERVGRPPTTPPVSRGGSTTQLPPTTQSIPPARTQTSTVPSTTTTVPTTTTTTTTTVPATTTVAPAPSISEAEARQIIAAYYAAYRARDFNALQAIFPTASQIDRQKMDALRKDYERCEYETKGMQVRPVSATEAFVRVEVTETCKARIRMNTPVINATRTFGLAKSADGRWLVISGP